MAEVDSIARLLADPDPGVATALRKQLAARPEDPPGLREAVEALEDPADRSRAREARLEVVRERAADRLIKLARSPGEPSLEEGAFAVARLEDPDCDVEAARRKLDELGSRLRAVVAGGPGTIPLVGTPPPADSPRARIALVAWFLGENEGFDGDRDEYDAPRNSVLPAVLERKRGLPIALGVVYLLVAARAGVDLYGVGAPSHFLVGGATDQGPVYLDPFAKGRMLEAVDVAELLRAMGVAFRAEFLAPTGPRRILARMARNLANYHGKRPRTTARVQRFVRVALAFEGSDL